MSKWQDARLCMMVARLAAASACSRCRLRRRTPTRRPASSPTRSSPGERAAAIDMIAKKSADVNAAEADGSTPLLWAANLNDTDLAVAPVEGGRESQSPQSTGIHAAGGSRAQCEHRDDQGAARRGRRSECRRAGRPDAADDGRPDVPNVAAAKLLARQGRESQREGSAARADRADVGGRGQPGRR